jgi:hypothetical protein
MAAAARAAFFHERVCHAPAALWGFVFVVKLGMLVHLLRPAAAAASSASRQGCAQLDREL